LIFLLLQAPLALAAGGLDFGLTNNLSTPGFSGYLGFYAEGAPFAARGRLLFGESGGLVGGLDLLYRPLELPFIKPYLGAGAQTLIAKVKPAGGLQMAAGTDSYAVLTAGLQIALARINPYVELSYCYGASSHARAALGLVWSW